MSGVQVIVQDVTRTHLAEVALRALSPDAATDNASPTAAAVAADVDPQNVVPGGLLTYTGADLEPVAVPTRETVVTRSDTTAKPAKENKANKDKKEKKGKSKGKKAKAKKQR